MSFLARERMDDARKGWWGERKEESEERGWSMMEC
jgi:hypothetical protein